jgi:hypothetical protein
MDQMHYKSAADLASLIRRKKVSTLESMHSRRVFPVDSTGSVSVSQTIRQDEIVDPMVHLACRTARRRVAALIGPRGAREA